MTTNTIKEQHLAMLRKAFFELKTATKPQLAEHTGLSVVTINSLIKELEKNGELIQETQTLTSGGRPAALYSLNKDHKLALIFGTREKAGKDHITAAVVNLYDETLEEPKQLRTLTPETIEMVISSYLEAYPTIQLVVFALPAKESDGKLVFCDYTHLEGFPLRAYIMARFQLPCLIENDIRISVGGYFYQNPEAQMQIVAGVYFPQKYSTGVGVFINGQLLSGTSGMASEIEYLPFFRDMDWPNRTLEDTISLLKTVCVMYNPDTLILYDEFLTPEMFAQIEASFDTDNYHHFRPNFIHIPHMEGDYIFGLRHFALSALYDCEL